MNQVNNIFHWLNIRLANCTATLSILTISFCVMAEQKLENGPALEDSSKLEAQGGLATNLDEVNGLIIDRTMTRLGANFYTAFSQLVNDRHENLKENITVKERPTALSGSIITIFHLGKPIYKTALSPARKLASERAEQAMSVVSSYISSWEVQRLFQDKFDLDSDEL